MSTHAGLLIWWSSNTRSAAVLAYLAATNGIPLFIVLDPEVAPPSSQTRSRAEILERPLKDVTVDELSDISLRAVELLDLDHVVLCPTSEYIQTVAVGSESKFEHLVTLPQGDLPYVNITSKQWLAKNGAAFGVPTPRVLASPVEELPLPFVAKPRTNVDNGIALKPFLVESPSSLIRFKEQAELFFAEEVVRSSSEYWCAYRNSQGQVASYFQRNILQEPGGGSIVFARRGSPSRGAISCADALTELMNSTNYRGPLMAEIRSGLVTEINPRFWGPLQLDSTGDGSVVRAFFADCFDADIQVRLPRCRSYIVPSRLNDSVRCRDAIRTGQKRSVTARVMRKLAILQTRPIRSLPAILGGAF